VATSALYLSCYIRRSLLAGNHVISAMSRDHRYSALMQRTAWRKLPYSHGRVNQRSFTEKNQRTLFRGIDNKPLRKISLTIRQPSILRVGGSFDEQVTLKVQVT